MLTSKDIDNALDLVNELNKEGIPIRITGIDEANSHIDLSTVIEPTTETITIDIIIPRK